MSIDRKEKIAKRLWSKCIVLSRKTTSEISAVAYNTSKSLFVDLNNCPVISRILFLAKKQAVRMRTAVPCLTPFVLSRHRCIDRLLLFKLFLLRNKDPNEQTDPCEVEKF